MAMVRAAACYTVMHGVGSSLLHADSGVSSLLHGDGWGSSLLHGDGGGSSFILSSIEGMGGQQLATRQCLDGGGGKGCGQELATRLWSQINNILL